jgi:hypothetical protein
MPIFAGIGWLPVNGVVRSFGCRGLQTPFWEIALNREPETGSLAAEVTLATCLF